MPQRQIDEVDLADSPLAPAFALNLLTKMDLLRLKTIARLHARGLPPDVGWMDLLQEAFTRVLQGRRPPPQEIPLVAFLAGVMRSIKSQWWRRARAGLPLRSAGWTNLEKNEPTESDIVETGPDPEQSLIALQELDFINELFAKDILGLKIITALGEGHTPEEIRQACGLSQTDYDSARKRIRRVFLKEGLTMSGGKDERRETR